MDGVAWLFGGVNEAVTFFFFICPAFSSPVHRLLSSLLFL